MSQLRIVHVDDSTDYWEPIRRAFLSLAPAVTISPFQYGQDAVRHLELCGQGAIPLPELVLVDRRMPFFDGFEVVQAIRAMPHLASVPVFMLSNTCDDEHVHRATALGADGYIKKPTGDHLALVRDILARRPWRREQVEHGLSTVPVRELSLPVSVPVASTSMPPAAALALPTGPGFWNTLFAHLAHVVPALAEVDPNVTNGMFVNQDEVDITFAERQARVTRRQVVDLTRHTGYDMDEKRRNYFRALYARGMTLSQMHEAYPMFSLDYFKRLRPPRKSSAA